MRQNQGEQFSLPRTRFIGIFAYVILVLSLSLFLLVAIKENIENEHIIYSLTALFRTLKSSLEEPHGSVRLMAQEELPQHLER